MPLSRDRGLRTLCCLGYKAQSRIQGFRLSHSHAVRESMFLSASSKETLMLYSISSEGSNPSCKTLPTARTVLRLQRATKSLHGSTTEPRAGKRYQTQLAYCLQGCRRGAAVSRAEKSDRLVDHGRLREDAQSAQRLPVGRLQLHEHQPSGRPRTQK